MFRREHRLLKIESRYYLQHRRKAGYILGAGPWGGYMNGSEGVTRESGTYLGSSSPEEALYQCRHYVPHDEIIPIVEAIVNK